MLKDIIIKKYGSIGRCYDTLAADRKGKMPFSRDHFYNLANGLCKNPGIRTLIKLSKMIGVNIGTVIADYLGDENAEGRA